MLSDNDNISEDDFELNDVLKREERERVRDNKRPVIDHLPDAIVEVDGKITLVPKVGQRLLIERYTTYGEKPRWFDTKTYEIKHINVETGAVRLFDYENQNYASTNFITGFKNDTHRFKVPFGKKVTKKQFVRDKEKEETKATKEPKQSDGLRMVYSKRGVIHTRIKGQAYGPGGETKTKPGDRLKMTVKGDVIIVDDVTNGFTETWNKIKV